jgi:hypothetical protein
VTRAALPFLVSSPGGRNEANNPRTRRWLDSGNGVDAIVGNGDYFIPSPAYGDGDPILVMGQLLTWVAEGHADVAVETFEMAVTSGLARGSFAEAAR